MYKKKTLTPANGSTSTPFQTYEEWSKAHLLALEIKYGSEALCARICMRALSQWTNDHFGKRSATT
jgi:hypothetical protein